MNQYDVAPLEGITGYVFRNVHHRYFPGVRKYYIPFIEPKPKAKKIFTGREMGDILPEHNEGIPVVPQILTNKWEDFLWTAEPSEELWLHRGELECGMSCKDGGIEKPWIRFSGISRRNR